MSFLPFDAILCKPARRLKSIILVGQWNRSAAAGVRLLHFCDVSACPRCGRCQGRKRTQRVPARNSSVRHPSRAQQPAVHDLPLVPSSWLKTQKRRSRLFQLKKELERISGARCSGIDGLRLDPSVPLPDNQRLHVFLFHSTHAGRIVNYLSAIWQGSSK